MEKLPDNIYVLDSDEWAAFMERFQVCPVCDKVTTKTTAPWGYNCDGCGAGLEEKQT